MTGYADHLRMQGIWCERLGSPLYATLLDRAADDFTAGGPVAAALDGYPHQPVASAMALRLMGAIHRLVLAGGASNLARHYPSVGGDGDAAAAWPRFRAVVEAHCAELRRAVAERSVQTNEVARAAALVCGFLDVTRATGLPLRCLEIGASAGLNLRWDHFRYEAAGVEWGDPGSPVVLSGCYQPGRLPFDMRAVVVERAGCDPSPVDPTADEGRLKLASYVWADQTARLALLRAACDVAARVHATLDRANGADWASERLAVPVVGTATVVYHSIVIQYLDQASRDRLIATIADAGARATEASPVAWLRMEPGGEQAEIRMTLWPGGEERLVATAGFHGRNVRYLGAAPADPVSS